METETNSSIDRIQGEKFIRSELAIECIAEMIGYAALELMQEEKKAQPDIRKIAEIRAEKDVYLQEQKRVYAGDIDIQIRVIEQYAPVIKKRYV